MTTFSHQYSSLIETVVCWSDTDDHATPLTITVCFRTLKLMIRQDVISKIGQERTVCVGIKQFRPTYTYTSEKLSQRIFVTNEQTHTRVDLSLIHISEPTRPY